MGPLLERDQETRTFTRIVESAREGRGELLLIAGEAGIGKTSLIRAVRDMVRGEVAFAIGACEPLSVPIPLAPIRELAAAAGQYELSALEGDDRLALARSLRVALTGSGPAVAVIEDAHWADPATLDVVRLLARRIDDSPLAVVVTYRDDELGANAPLAMLVGDLAGDRQVQRIALRPLSEGAVRALAGPAGIDSVELSRVTGGNPFLVVEALASEEGVPVSVREATLARVSRLGASARGVVDAAAVLGQRFTPGRLSALVPHSVDAVEEALSRGVLTDDGSTLGFRHELLRKAVEASISAPRRAELHARVMNALADSDGVSHARLAHHAELAGWSAEAARYAVLAAAEAERVGALREASLQLERALRVRGDGPREERFELLLRYARAANFASRTEVALAGAEEAVELARLSGDGAKAGRASVVLAWALWSLDRVGEAREAARSAVRVLEGAGDAGERARAHAALIRMEATSFDSLAAVEAAPRALQLAEQAGLEEVELDVVISVGLARGHLGDGRAGEQLAGALARARAARLPIQTIRAYVNGIAVAVEGRDHETVDRLYADATTLFEASQTAIPRDYTTVLVARSLLDRGRLEEAVANAARSRRTRHGGVPIALAVEGLVRARRGEREAESVLQAALTELAGVPEGWRHGVVRSALAEAAWLRGDHAAGLEHALTGRAAPFADQFARSSGELALWAARCGRGGEPPLRAPGPIVLELAGDWRAAIDAWRGLDARYEAALAALAADDRVARAALATLHRLGAVGAARAFSRERATRGGRGLRGPRRTTLANPAGLTRREQEVLQHVAEGLTNAGIADALSLSERTVAHHVSAILGKLGVSTRTAAVQAARQTGVLAQDGPPEVPT